MLVPPLPDLLLDALDLGRTIPPGLRAEHGRQHRQPECQDKSPHQLPMAPSTDRNSSGVSPSNPASYAVVSTSGVCSTAGRMDCNWSSDNPSSPASVASTVATCCTSRWRC